MDTYSQPNSILGHILGLNEIGSTQIIYSKYRICKGKDVDIKNEDILKHLIKKIKKIHYITFYVLGGLTAWQHQ